MSAEEAVVARRRWLPVGRGDRAATAAGVFLVIVVLAAIAAPWVAPHDPTATNLSQTFLRPWIGNPLGTDSSGRDILSRIVFGARTTLIGPLVIVGIATVVGVGLALVAGWFGGWVDSLVCRLLEGLMVLPGLLLALVASAIFGSGVLPAAVALSIAYVPYIGRITRSGLLTERGRPYIAALQIQGLSTARIWCRHLIPNVGGLITAQMTLNFGYALIDMASISYLGLGVQPPDADWGVMVASGQSGLLRGYPAEALAAGVAVLLTVLAFNTVGDRLEKRFRV